MDKKLLRCASGFMLVALCCAIPVAAQDTPAPPSPAAPDADTSLYRLAPGDVVLVRFFFNPELNEEVQIRPDGRFSMQLIGEIEAGGRTVTSVVQELEKRYATEIKSPRITVQVRSYGGQKVFVTGEVVRPGVVSLIGGLNVVSAIGEAGGVRQAGKTKSVILIRRGADGKPVARKLSLGSQSNPLPDAGLALQPFDVLIVPPRVIAQIDRFVDEYIRQANPANLNVGFQYLYNRAASSVSVVPF
jgi:protein involved in polysaccharide export with SLBB domain